MTALARPVLVFDHVEPWQRLDLEHVNLTAAQCEEAVEWVAADGSVASGQYAVIEALRHAGGVWTLLGRGMALPAMHQLAGVVYRWIARNRYRMPGGTPACQLPSGGDS